MQVNLLEVYTREKIVEDINKYGGYPVIEMIQDTFRMKAKPTGHNLYADGGMGFNVNGGSLNPETPQHTCVSISKDARLYRIEPNPYWDGKSLNNIGILNNENRLIGVIYYPEHLYNGGLKEGTFKMLTKAILGKKEEHTK
ncbi:hypothetical protein HZI73_26215 (plasmid) [Vallitalea pronyensis]|uniref:Uncharacterized protein n=1 Tax=Vallitalea pronyensis TaxID=1348613 RepID=A0A8J8MQC1_9FIRM|nr:hypothetical protein [Vallitalea pronyensis]QUI25910.1 hypothetical protein HZI73_26215 [Vallitalea pronyensis]